FARLDEARKSGMHAAGPRFLTPQQTAVAECWNHNHDRIEAREVFGFASNALALPAGFYDGARLTADSAIFVSRVPFENRLGAAKNGEIAARQARTEGA